jgi:hypothetical protein
VSGQQHRVAIVVDRSFGERIADLARTSHVWAVESPENTPAIREVWDREAADPDPGADPLGPGVTSFAADEAESPEETCLRIADVVDEHHGAHDPPWCEIEVFGVELSPALRELFLELGAATFERTSAGFLCRPADPRQRA